MLIEYDGGSRECFSREEIRAVLSLRNENSTNEFWISRISDSYPCMALLVKGDSAHVSYFPEDGQPGFVSLNGADSSGETVFIKDFVLDSENMVEYDEAVTAVLRFYESPEMPNNLDWLEL
jgi:hypothetical protein